MSYQPIENYGIIGNMRTVELVGMNGFACSAESARSFERRALRSRVSWSFPNTVRIRSSMYGNAAPISMVKRRS